MGVCILGPSSGMQFVAQAGTVAACDAVPTMSRPTSAAARYMHACVVRACVLHLSALLLQPPLRFQTLPLALLCT